MPAGRLPIPIEERFWPKVDRRSPDECWPWIGAEHGNGYGGISVLGQSMPAHRVSYTLHFGSLPEDKFVLHRCDNPRCVNPAHLEFGRYLAAAAERFMAEQNRATEAEEMPDADYWRALESAIGEFRKRADRAMPPATEPQSPT